MSSTKRTKKFSARRKDVVVSKDVKDMGNDPFFVKKAKEAEAFLKKYGLPKELSNKARSS